MVVHTYSSKTWAVEMRRFHVLDWLSYTARICCKEQRIYIKISLGSFVCSLYKDTDNMTVPKIEQKLFQNLSTHFDFGILSPRTTGTNL